MLKLRMLSSSKTEPKLDLIGNMDFVDVEGKLMPISSNWSYTEEKYEGNYRDRKWCFILPGVIGADGLLIIPRFSKKIKFMTFQLERSKNGELYWCGFLITTNTIAKRPIQKATQCSNMYLKRKYTNSSEEQCIEYCNAIGNYINKAGVVKNEYIGGQYITGPFTFGTLKPQIKKTLELKENLEEVKASNRTNGKIIEKFNNSFEEFKMFMSNVRKNIKPFETQELTIQHYLETRYRGGHQMCLAGIPDIVTDTELIEIKNWSRWKEALGQLMSYSIHFPGRKMIVYLFGTVPESDKYDNVIKTFKLFDIEVLEHDHQLWKQVVLLS